MSVAERVHLQEEASAARTRSYVLPIALALVLFAAIVTLQFTSLLGKNGFIAQFPLALGFYYCYAWHNRLAAKAKAKQSAADRS